MVACSAQNSLAYKQFLGFGLRYRIENIEKLGRLGKISKLTKFLKLPNKLLTFNFALLT